MKSSRVKSAWAKRKKQVESKPLKELLPLWLDVKGGKVVQRPERVAVVQRIFQLVRQEGLGAVMRRLNQEGVPTFKPRVSGIKSIWQKSSLAKIVQNRAVLGELDVDGERKQVLPRIVSERDFLDAQQAVERRRGSGGRDRSKAVNLFTSLVIDGEDLTRWSVARSGNPIQGKRVHIKYLENVAGQQAGAHRKAIPYHLFEPLLLQHLREVKPADLLPADNRQQANHLDELADKVARAKLDLLEVQAEADAAPKEIRSLAQLMVSVETRMRKAQAEYDALKRELAAPAADALVQVQSLLGMAEDPEIRPRLRAKIAAVLEAIMVYMDRPATHFAPRRVIIRVEYRTTYSTTIVAEYTPGHSGHRQESLRVIQALPEEVAERGLTRADARP